MNRIKGKLALVTGASAGIGEAVAVKFAENGANLILAARRMDRISKLAEKLTSKYGVKIYTYELDVRKRADVKKFGEELINKGLLPDILVNNAGLARGQEKLFEGNIDDWEEMIDTNLKGVLYVTRALLPEMVKRNSGHIINLGSTAGDETYIGGNVYNMTKFGMKAFSSALNKDLINTRLKVSNIAPGACNTEFSTVRFKGDKALADSKYVGYTPLTGEDVADLILYVANAPEHVNVAHTVIRPTAQRSSELVGW